MATSCALTVYSYQNVAVSLAGRPVSLLWEGDDAVQIEPNSDIGTPMPGADGSVLMSISADRSVQITLRLQGTSPTHAWLQNRYRQMRNGLAVPFTISIRDTGTGEGGNSSDAMIMQAPTRQFGVNAASRDWVIFAQCWETNPIQYTL